MQSVATADEEDDEVIDEVELAALRAAAKTVPATRGWSTPNFACLRQPPSCLLSCCCPCVQFGFNQRMAFQESCIKWTLFWLCPLLLLFIVATALLADDGGGTAELVLRNIDLDPDAPPPPQPRSRAPYVLPPAMVLVGLVGCMRRKLLRQKYGIAGRCARRRRARSPPPAARPLTRPAARARSSVSDFLCHAFCTCCSLAREAREIQSQTLADVLGGADLEVV